MAVGTTTTTTTTTTAPTLMDEEVEAMAEAMVVAARTSRTRISHGTANRIGVMVVVQARRVIMRLTL